MHKRNKEYEICGAGCYILEFKFQDKCWAIDATKEDGSFGRLINHSKMNANVKPVVIPENGVPSVYLVAVHNIGKDDEILYDYGDDSKLSKLHFPLLRN